MTATQILACQCGRFHLQISGDPFVTSECHCNSCRDAAGRMQTSRPMTGDNGGTPFVLYRKDRVQFLDGTGLLRGHRLSEGAPTRRVVTTCCNTPAFLEFQSGHWLSLYASLWPEATRPASQIRTMTSDLPSTAQLDTALPSGKWTTTRFYGKLLAAWIAMGFKSPKLDVEEAKPA